MVGWLVGWFNVKIRGSYDASSNYFKTPCTLVEKQSPPPSEESIVYYLTNSLTHIHTNTHLPLRKVLLTPSNTLTHLHTSL